MLNDLNVHGSDPKTGSNSLKCAISIASVFFALFILILFSSAIYSCASFIFFSIVNSVSAFFVTAAQFLKPIFDSIGIPIIVFSAFVSLWSFCVFKKIQPDCFVTSAQWLKISVTTIILSSLYNILYIIYLETSENTIQNYGGIYGFSVIIYMVLLFNISIVHLERKERASIKK